jgi:hypothetical protein
MHQQFSNAEYIIIYCSFIINQAKYLFNFITSEERTSASRHSKRHKIPRILGDFIFPAWITRLNNYHYFLNFFGIAVQFYF